MTCTDFFAPHVAFLNGSPPPPTGQGNALRFIMTSNRDEKNHFVFFADGRFVLSGSQLTSPSVQLFFSDRVIGGQSFDVNQPETDVVKLVLPNGPLQRLDQSGNIIATYSTLECRDNGLLICTSDFTREIVVLSFEHVLDTLTI